MALSLPLATILLGALPAASLQPVTEPAAGSPAVDYTPTSSKAPDSADVPAEPPPPEPEGPEEEKVEDLGEPQTEQPPPESLDDARKKSKEDKDAFNRHGIGARGGITIIPTWILNKFLATHSNALCKGETVGKFADTRGLLKQDGCNFYVGGEYVYRHSRVFDVVTSVGYQRAHAPDGYWLDKQEWGDGCSTHNGNDCNLAAADYTQVRMGMVFIEADFIARAPVVVTKDVEFGIGGGAGIGVGIVTGGIYQTPLGSAPGGFTNGTVQNTCQRLEDLADFTRCTPRYDPTEDDPPRTPAEVGAELSEPNALGYANCTKDSCNEGDLQKFGYRKKQGDVWPVIPVVNLLVSMRLIVKDVFGITLTGGFQTGFYFGGGMNYFFGKKGSAKGGPAPAKKGEVTAYRPPSAKSFWKSLRF